jgi:hypothetical protein
MPIRWAYLKRVLAGAIFGLYMAHLLYFLNPQVDITPWRLASVTLVYGITCGLLFGSILWGFRALRVFLLGRPDPYRTHGFGFVVCAAFVSSFIYWMHLNLLRIDLYLPVGAVRILSKATILITATAFILLVLWVIERNADRRTSRAIFIIGVVLIAISSVFLYQRRDSFHTDRQEVVVTTIRAVAGQPVILVAIRNLPYDWIVTMKGEGLVPWLESATETAYFTRLEPFPTTSPKSLWASLATGKLPYRHGVTGRFSYRTPLNTEPFLLLPYGVGFRAWGLIPPVERISAPLPSGDALPLWAMFERLQLPAQVIRWRSVKTRPHALRPNDPQVTTAMKRFDASGAARPQILAALSADLGAATAVDGSAVDGMALTALELDGFELAQRALRVYLNEIPPRGTVKGDAVRAYVQQLDRALAEIARKHPQHLIVVTSPHAVTPPRLPADVWALVQDAVTRDDPGADDGFVLVTGPKAAHRQNPATARVVDVVPTLLFGSGLPIGRDMDGRILTDAFTDDVLRRSAVSVIQTYEAERVVVRRGSN